MPSPDNIQPDNIQERKHTGSASVDPIKVGGTGQPKQEGGENLAEAEIVIYRLLTGEEIITKSVAKEKNLLWVIPMRLVDKEDKTEGGNSGGETAKNIRVEVYPLSPYSEDEVYFPNPNTISWSYKPKTGIKNAYLSSVKKYMELRQKQTTQQTNETPDKSGGKGTSGFPRI